MPGRRGASLLDGMVTETDSIDDMRYCATVEWAESSPAPYAPSTVDSFLIAVAGRVAPSGGQWQQVARVRLSSGVEVTAYIPEEPSAGSQQVRDEAAELILIDRPRS